MKVDKRGRVLPGAVVVVVSLGLALGGCLPFGSPIVALPSPAASVAPSEKSSPSSSPSASASTRTSTSATASVSATNPFAAKRVDLAVGFTAPQTTSMTCDGSSATLGVARAGSYAGFVNQAAAGVFDVATGRWLWCVPTGFGGADGVAAVTTDSSVGRPGYEPTLDTDTLEATEYDSQGKPFFLRSDAETLLVVPVTIDRPQIGSQKEAKLRGLLAFDGHGVKKWIAALPQTSGAGSPYCSDDATVCVVQQGSNWSQVALLEVTARTGELIVLAEGVYLNTDATQGPVGTESFVVKNGRFETLWARYESEADLQLLTNSTGKAHRTSWYVGVIDRWVVAGDEADHQANKIMLLDTTTGAKTQVPFAYSKNSCLSLPERVMVCRGQNPVASIGAFNLLTGEVLWEWQEDDPDPVTQVPRKVPRDLYVYDGLIVASYKDSEARYLIDAETGTDQPFTAKMAAAFELLITDKYNAYGSVYASSGNIEYSRAK